MRSIIIIILSLFITLLACSQGRNSVGYIVSLNGDTIYGEIKDLDWVQSPSTIKFRSSTSSDLKDYGVSNIKAFYSELSDKHYENHFVELNISSHLVSKLNEDKLPQTSTKSLFLEVLYSGQQVRLLTYKDKEHRDHYFIQMNLGKPIELIYHKYYAYVGSDRTMSGRAAKGIIEVKQYLGQLNYYFRDCSSINKKINSITFTKRSLINIFNEYEVCKGGATIFKSKVEKSNKYLSLYGGMNFSRLKISYGGPNALFNQISENSPNAGLGPNIGFNFTVGLKGKFELINFYTGANYYTRQVGSSFEFGGEDASSRNHASEYSITSHYLDFSFGLGFHFANDKTVRPYLKVLATSHLKVGGSAEFTSNSWLAFDPDNVITTMPTLFDNENSEKWTLSPTLSFGVFIKDLFIEASYLLNYKGQSQVIELNDKEHHIFLNIGYQFSLNK